MLDGNAQTGKNKRKYLGNSNVKWGSFNLINLAEMDFSEKDMETFSLKYHDILICEGGEVGRTAIWKGEIEDCFFQKALHRVRLNLTKAVPEYVLQLMWFFSKYDGFKDSVSVATIPHLTGVKLKEMPIPLPPIKLQQKFADIVAQSEFLRQKQQQSEMELEYLFQGLLQRYFG